MLQDYISIKKYYKKSSIHLQLKKGIPNFALPKGTIPLRIRAWRNW